MRRRCLRRDCRGVAVVMLYSLWLFGFVGNGPGPGSPLPGMMLSGRVASYFKNDRVVVPLTESGPAVSVVAHIDQHVPVVARPGVVNRRPSSGEVRTLEHVALPDVF